MSFLEIKNLFYTYPGGIRAVDGLDLTAEKGEFVAVIGPNAAGKSTLALLVKGILQPDSGSISLGGAMGDPGRVDPRVGLLFSNPENQLVTSIVEEDVAFGLEVAALPPAEIRRKVESVLSELGIEHLRDRMPHKLSGGEQQMTALAGVMVMEPDLLILDEPTAYLDPVARAAVIKAVTSLARRGTAVILITHDIARAAGADRVVVMDGGKVALEGAPGELFAALQRAPGHGIEIPFTIRLASELDRLGIPVPVPANNSSLSRAVTRAMERTGKQAGPDGTGVDPDIVEDRAAPGGPSVLRMEKVNFSYRIQDRAASTLHDIEIDVPEGSITLLCGPNGSGKSTLLQLTNGLIHPDGGRVLFRGKELAFLRRSKGGIPMRVALLFQNPERQLFCETVFEDVAFGPRNLGLDPGEVARRVTRALRWVGLGEDLLKRSVHSLSGGQMRRVAIAGVLAMETDLLVLDEPTDGLDPSGVREFFSQARHYCESTGTAILMATHEIPEQVAMVDFLWYLDYGKVLSSGTPLEVLTGPHRTVPEAFLPDHLAVRQELERKNVPFGSDDMSPERVLEKILAFLSPPRDKI
ncbi:MAG: energy-coupling factor transporter ATPase [bacterium]|nr:energy-coupling factor transporter ATPase [bacterium]MDT8395433.1 energy-coupling factor transporter ATPase [bacterium]